MSRFVLHVSAQLRHRHHESHPALLIWHSHTCPTCVVLYQTCQGTGEIQTLSILSHLESLQKSQHFPHEPKDTMPNKKSKGNASKGSNKSSTPSPSPPSAVAAAAARRSAPVEPPTTTSKAKLAANARSDDDFWTKNARAKALIMSTLVPGSEPWKIAEPIELAANIMKALEDKYAPRDEKDRPIRLGLPAPDGKHRPVGQDEASSSDFIGDFVSGKSMDKYVDWYTGKTSSAPPSAGVSEQAKKTVASLNRASDIEAFQMGFKTASFTDPIGDGPPPPGEKRRSASVAQRQSRALPPTLSRPPSQPPSEPQPPIPQLPPKIPAPPASSPPPSSLTQAPRAPTATTPPPLPSAATPPSKTTREEVVRVDLLPRPKPPSSSSPAAAPTAVTHDACLSESRATLLAQNDQDRKRQIQVAATKVLMQKLPTRDLRFLWAMLYGGGDAPWPGSCTAVIPGVNSPYVRATKGASLADSAVEVSLGSGAEGEKEQMSEKKKGKMREEG